MNNGKNVKKKFKIENVEKLNFSKCNYGHLSKLLRQVSNELSTNNYERGNETIMHSALKYYMSKRLEYIVEKIKKEMNKRNKKNGKI